MPDLNTPPPEEALAVEEMNLRLRLDGWQVAGAWVHSADGHGRYVVAVSRGDRLIRVEADGAAAAWSEAYRRAWSPGRGVDGPPSP